MCLRALAVFLAIVMAWMGLTAQQQAATVFSEGLTESSIAEAEALPLSSTGGSLDEHHLDDLPIQLLADLIGLLGLVEHPAVPGVAVRPAAPWPVGWPAPDLADPQRPPIARG